MILGLILGFNWLIGDTINRITLFAFIISLGLLVDDSVVVMENIHRHIYRKYHPNFYRLILLAIQEIGPSTIIATLTIIIALFSMQFVSGMVGAFMKPISLNAPITMFLSLLTAYSIVPFLSYHFLRKKAKNRLKSSDPHPHYAYLGKVYEK